MKVKLTKEIKQVITVAQMPAVNAIIKDFRENSIDDFKSEIQTAVQIASKCYYEKFEILKCDAEICCNSRICNYYNENSENFDIWFTVYAYHQYIGFFEIGVYLSDLWRRCGSTNDNDIRQHMCIISCPIKK